MRFDLTPEAQAVREQRLVARRRQGDDVLAVRARKIAFWKRSPWHQRDREHISTIYGHPGFRRLVLPGLQAMLNARERAHRERIAAETRDFDERRRARKAAAARAAGPQPELF